MPANRNEPPPLPKELPETVGEQFPSPYLHAADLPPQGKVATVSGHEFKMLRPKPTKDYERTLLLSFDKARKVLVMNKTRSAQLEALTGTDKFKEWQGVRVLLKPGRADSGERTVDILRAPEIVQRTGETPPAEILAAEQAMRKASEALQTEPSLMAGAAAAQALEEHVQNALETIKTATDLQRFGRPSQLADQLRALNGEMPSQSALARIYTAAVARWRVDTTIATEIAKECSGDWLKAIAALDGHAF